MADKVVAKYVADVKDYIKEIEKATGIAQKDFQKVNETAGGLEKGLKKIGGAVAAAFAVDKIVSFTAEASKLAAEGEGVRKAFQRIGDPQLLQGLRNATRGTVSDLELMKQAVRASNFKIPLESLAKLFEFARRRAKETGESVDYLVNSITMGIGRKSPLILDNLGISAIELRKRFDGITVAQAEVGDVARIVGEIATEEMAKMGDEVDTTADKMQQLSASTDNLKEALGRIANEAVGPITAGLASITQAIADEMTEVSRFADSLVNASVGQLDVAIMDQQKTIEQLEQDLTERIGKISDAQMFKAQEIIDTEREKLEIAQQLRAEREESITIDEMTISNIDKIVASTKQQNQQTVEQIHNVFYYKALIEELTDEQDAENTSLARNTAIVKELIVARKELNKLLGKETKFKDIIDDEEVLPMIGLQQEAFNLGETLNQVFGDDSMKFFEMYREQMIKTEDMTRESFDNQKMTVADYANIATSTYSGIADIAMQQFQKQNDFEMKMLEDRLQRGEITEEEFAKKSADLKRKSAQQSKDLRLFETIINTATGVISALASSPPNVPQSIATGVAGGLQAALIASQPLPQFAKGTKNAPEGFKWVGEEGPELIYDRGGYPIITHRESMKILEKYNIESVDIDSIQRGGFESMAASAKLQGFSDSNILVATDRLRESNKRGFVYMADRIADAMKKSSRNEW